MGERVLYAELTPNEFRRRLQAAPIAYLPLGTLEWHGEHLPLGADGIQSEGFFERLARRVGGIVLPMLFLGPDRRQVTDDGRELYGMDCGDFTKAHAYAARQLAGSAYWVSDETFAAILEGTIRQLARAGFRIVVGHGHGPSTKAFTARFGDWQDRLGLRCFNCFGSEYDRDGLGIQVDHAAMNETSLVMALRPELVSMDSLPPDPNQFPLGVGGRDPRRFASPEVGEKALNLQLERMAKILCEALQELA